MKQRIIICTKQYSTISVNGSVIITPLTKDLIKVRIDNVIYIGLMLVSEFNKLSVMSTKEDVNMIKRLLDEEYQDYELLINK